MTHDDCQPDAHSAAQNAAAGTPGTSGKTELAALLTRISWDMPGARVEQESFARIEALCGPVRNRLTPDQWHVARRLIHTTADLSLGDQLVFRHDPVQSGVQALQRGANIVCDSRMIRAGLSLARLRQCHPRYTETSLICHAADSDVAREAAQRGCTRALCAMEKTHALGELEGALVLIGNAPLALARLCRFILEEQVRPALVVGMPVGFVNVLEAKELLAFCPVPHIVLEGRRGGSPLAVATLHALTEVVLEERAQDMPSSQDPRAAQASRTSQDLQG